MSVLAAVVAFVPMLPGAGGAASMNLLEQERSLAASVVFDGVVGGGGADDQFISADGFAAFDESISLAASSPDEGESSAQASQQSWIERHGFGFSMSTAAQASTFGAGSNGDASARAVFSVRFTLDRSTLCHAPFSLDYFGEVREVSALLSSTSGFEADFVALGEQPALMLPPGEYLFEARIGGVVAAQDNNSSDMTIVMSGGLLIVPAPHATPALALAVFGSRRRRRG